MASGIESPFGLLSTTAGSNAEGQHKHVDRRKHEEPHKRGALRRHHRQRTRISRRDRKPNVGPMGTAPDLHNQLFALASSSEALALPWDWHERSIESRLPASRRSQQRSQSNLYASGFLHHTVLEEEQTKQRRPLLGSRLVRYSNRLDFSRVRTRTHVAMQFQLWMRWPRTPRLEVAG
jgi:hypothetical protein